MAKRSAAPAEQSQCGDCSPWDPFNVTEDADLGIRAAVLGYRVSVINSTTYEEANAAVGNWIRQRSRWIQGYLQTLPVHLRQPTTIIRGAGWKQSLSFILLPWPQRSPHRYSPRTHPTPPLTDGDGREPC